MKREIRMLLRGVGIGMIISSTLFFLVLTFYVPNNHQKLQMDDTWVIERAREMGMIFVSELRNQQQSDGNQQQNQDEEQNNQIEQ